MKVVDRLLKTIDQGTREPVYLVSGDRVLAEPAAGRIGDRLASLAECQVEIHRRPAGLGSILADLKTFSLFATAAGTTVTKRVPAEAIASETRPGVMPPSPSTIWTFGAPSEP